MDWSDVTVDDGSIQQFRGKKSTSQRAAYRMMQEELMLQRTLTEPAYLLHVKLRYIDDPPVERTLRVPTTITFHQLHGILQYAFGWADCHLYSFSLFGKRDPNERFTPGYYRPKEFLYEDPEEMNDMRVEGEPMCKSSKTRRLNQVFGGSRIWPEPPATIEYEYDMEDGWEHDITFLGTTDDEEFSDMQTVHPDRPGQEVVCLEAKGHPVAEDCGGVYGWERLKKSFSTPDGPDAAHLRQWYTNQCVNRPNYERFASRAEYENFDPRVISFKVEGTVQGVNFRSFTAEKAQSLSVTGYVKNASDGTVVGEAQGSSSNLDKFVQHLNMGPRAAKVSKVDQKDIDTKDGESSFEQ
ncbi:uncharacterized protein RHO25_012072 [Cercospora beticola]|uniref:acylphosphatase n=1 Tax=Cercospora beticola TaxID=122368 RepID=A0ABZ0P6Q7_CERBT|nr:hypothetical protein RHO25_012072 [Cercospora beticola]